MAEAGGSRLCLQYPGGGVGVARMFCPGLLPDPMNFAAGVSRAHPADDRSAAPVASSQYVLAEPQVLRESVLKRCWRVLGSWRMQVAGSLVVVFFQCS